MQARDTVNRDELLAEIADLRDRLETAEQTLRAIRNDEVDAFVVEVQGRGEEVLALQHAHDGYCKFVELMSLAAATMSEDGTVLYCNRQLGTLLGEPAEQIIGSSLLRFVAEPDEGVFRALLTEGTAKPLDGKRLRLQGADGAVISVSFNSMPFPSDVAPGASAVCLVMTDLREQEALKAAEESSRAKDSFLASLSHELRTPLTPAMLALSAIGADPDMDPDLRATIGMVRRNLEVQARLIDDLLDMSRIVNGKLTLHAEDLSVHRLLEGVLGIVESDVRAQGLRVEMKLQAADDIVRADPARLQQVFWNLMKNAVKFNQHGGTIVVRTRNESQSQGLRLVVDVIDTGIGISSEALPRIFDAFEQGGTRITNRYGGLGLGLSICRAIVEMHGGQISAHSDGSNRGAQFTVELPTPHGQAGNARNQ